MQSLDERLRFAIINKRLVRITYHGAVRIGERHDYGIQRGAPKPLFYQLRRASDNYHGEGVTGWRLFTFRKSMPARLRRKYFSGAVDHCIDSI